MDVRLLVRSRYDDIDVRRRKDVRIETSLHRKPRTEQSNPVKPGGSDDVASGLRNAYEQKGRARLDIIEDHVRSIRCNERQVRMSSLQPFNSRTR